MGLTTRHGGKLSLQTFQELLRKPLYAGILCVEGWGVRVQGSFSPIVSAELFARVQAVLEGKALTATPHQRNHPNFPLRRFARCGICDSPLTGSNSKGRTSRYGYYRCWKRKCLAVKVAKSEMENQFLDFLRGLRPRPEYLRLFREIVLDVWKQRQDEAKLGCGVLQRRITDLEDRRRRLLEAYVYKSTVDADLYRREDDRLSQEIAMARLELHEAVLEELDIEGVLDFAEVVATDAARLWIEGSLDQRQRLQAALFPRGVTYAPGRGFGTAETSLFFTWLAAIPAGKSGKASPTGFEPVLPA